MYQFSAYQVFMMLINGFAGTPHTIENLRHNLVLAAVVLLIGFLFASPVAANVFTVSTLTELNQNITDAAGGNDVTIIIANDIGIGSSDSITAITSGKNITLKPSDGQDVRIYRTGANSTVTSGMFTVRGGSLTLTDNNGGILTLDGNSTGITGDNNQSLVRVSDPGSFTMSGGKLCGNNLSIKGSIAYGGGVYVTGSGCSFVMSGGEISGNTVVKFGGGVYVSSGASFTLSGGNITDNSVTGDSGRGGGVSVESSGSFVMSGGNITDNSVTGGSGRGGGVSVERSGSFVMSGGNITGNRANFDGGGVYTDSSSFTMSGGNITGNTAKQNGGGVFVTSSSSFTMSDTAHITDNVANFSGGGVYVQGSGSSFTMSGTTAVTGNSANFNGGGVDVRNTASFSMSGGEISGNKALDSGGGKGGGVSVIGINTVFTMSDGNITGNTAVGSGSEMYYETGSFRISGPAFIGPNDMFLVADRNISVTTELTGIGGVQNITPASPMSPGTKIVALHTGATDAAYHNRFGLSTAVTTVVLKYVPGTPPGYQLALSVTDIVLDPNGGTSGTPSVSVSYDNKTFNRTISNPTRDGYTFLGWNTSSSGGITLIGTDGLLKNSAVNSTTIYTNATGHWQYAGPSPLTVFAQWESTVTGVTVSPSTAAVTTGGNQTFTATVAGAADQRVTWTVSGNTSSDTTIDASGNLSVSVDEAAVSLTVRATSVSDPAKSGTAAVTVSPVLYQITVQNDGHGTGTASRSSASAGTVITLSAVPDAGYSFKNWQIVSGRVTISGGSFTMPAENVVVKAVFEPTITPTPSGGGGSDGNMENAFRILFDSKGGSFVQPATGLSYGDRITKPTDPARNGYIFAGWYKDESCTIAWIFREDAVPGDITLYAKWNSAEATPAVTITPDRTTTAHPTTTEPAGQTVATTRPPATKTAGVSPTPMQTPAPVFGMLAGVFAAGVLMRRRRD